MATRAGLTEWLQQSRLVVVAVDPTTGRLRVRGSDDRCSDLACGGETVPGFSRPTESRWSGRPSAPTARNEHRPADPTDPAFYLRRPRGSVVHVWRLFRTKAEAVDHAVTRLRGDPSTRHWAETLPVEHFDDLVLPSPEPPLP